MKKISIITKFTEHEYVEEHVEFSNTEWLESNNFIMRVQLTENVNSYVLGGFANGQNRLTPLTYITTNFYFNQSFEFIKDDDSVITISYEDFEKVYRKAEETLQEQYVLDRQGKIGVDYLINIYENGDWE